MKTLNLILAALLLAGCAPAAATPEPIFTLVPTRSPVPATATPAAVTAAPPTFTAAPPPTATPAETGGGEPGALATVAPEGPAIAHLAAGQAITVTALDMLDTAAGWAVAETLGDADDRLLTTADGGRTWRDVTPPQPVDGALALGQGITFEALDTTTAWAVFYDRTAGPLGATPFVWRTVDGGQTWQPSAPLEAADAELFSPSDLAFTSRTEGWLLAHVGAGMMHDYVMVFATRDGGLSWDRTVDPFDTTETSLWQSCGKTGLAFADAQTGWVTGDCGGVQPGAPYLFKTGDGGLTWSFVELPGPEDRPDLYQIETNACGVQAPLFVQGPAVVLAVTCQDYNANTSLAYLYRSADGGAAWVTEPLGQGFAAANFLSPEVGWVLAPAAADPVQSTLTQTLDGGQGLNAVKQLNWTGPLDFVDAQTGWAVARAGEALALVQTTDGGRTWTVVTPQVAP